MTDKSTLSKRGSKNRAKGAAGEKEVIVYFVSATIQVENELGIPQDKRLSSRIQRNLQQSIAGGDDIVGIVGHSVEVKNCKVLQLDKWWLQCQRQAASHMDYMKPLLVYKHEGKWLYRTSLLVGTLTAGELTNYLPYYKAYVRQYYARKAFDQPFINSIR